MEKDMEKIREFFSHDRYAFDTGCFIEEVDDCYARVSLELDERHCNAVGGVMGGVYFTLADFAFAVAANWQKPGTVSISSDIAFVDVPRSKKIIAETALVRNGRTTCCYNISVKDDTGRAVAAVKIVGYHTGR